MRHSFSLHQAIGAPEPRRRFTLSGRLFSLHRLSGVRELRQRVRPDGRLLSLHRLSGVLELPQAGSPLTGGEFFAEPQRGIRRLRTAGACRAPRRGQKGRTTCGFPSSLNSYLSLSSQSGADCLHVTAPKIGNGSRVISAFVSQHIRSSQIDYCYTYGQLYAGCGITVPHNSIARYDRQHLRR